MRKARQSAPRHNPRTGRHRSHNTRASQRTKAAKGARRSR